jgi:hypothetical protein
MGTYGGHIFPATMATLTLLMILCYLVAHIVGLGLLSRLLESRQLFNRIYDWTGGHHTGGEQTKLLATSYTTRASDSTRHIAPPSGGPKKEYMSVCNFDTAN